MKNQKWEKEFDAQFDDWLTFMAESEYEMEGYEPATAKAREKYAKERVNEIKSFIRRLLKEEYKRGFRDGYGRGRLEAVESEELYREINKEVKK